MWKKKDNQEEKRKELDFSIASTNRLFESLPFEPFSESIIDFLYELQYRVIEYYTETDLGVIPAHLLVIGSTPLGETDAILHTIPISKDEIKKTFSKEDRCQLSEERGIRFVKMSELIKEYGFVVLINKEESNNETETK